MHIRKLFTLILLSAALAAGQAAKSPLKIPATRPNLYPAEVNAQEEIQQALTGATGKRVILVFGANWCGDCFALDYAFHQPKIEPLLNANFKVVHINVGQYDKNLDIAQKYKIPLEKGIPSLAILDSQGNLVTSTPDFEKARKMTEEDVIEFLKRWKPAGATSKASR